MLISRYKLRTTYLYNLQISIVTHCARASMYLNWLNIILLPLQSPHKRPSSFLESELKKIQKYLTKICQQAKDSIEN